MKSSTQFNILIAVTIIIPLIGSVVSFLLPLAGNWISLIAVLICFAPSCAASILMPSVSRHLNQLLRRELAADFVDGLIKKCEALKGDPLELAFMVNASVSHDFQKEGKGMDFVNVVRQEILSRVPEADERARLIGMAQIAELKWMAVDAG